MGGLEADETVAVEARIAEELLRLTRGRRVGRQVVPPAPYVRRHAVEYATAGQMLDERYLSAEFLPFVDVARLRPLVAQRGRDKQGSAGRPVLWRRGVARRTCGVGVRPVRMRTRWLSGVPRWVSRVLCPLRAGLSRWALCRTGSGEILGRHTDAVGAVATTVLSDGRPIAVIGSWDDHAP